MEQLSGHVNFYKKRLICIIAALCGNILVLQKKFREGKERSKILKWANVIFPSLDIPHASSSSPLDTEQAPAVGHQDAQGPKAPELQREAEGISEEVEGQV